MNRPVVHKNLLSTAFAIAAFAAPNLVRVFAQSLSHYGNPLPRFYDAEAALRILGRRPWVSRQRDRRARSILPAPWTSTGRKSTWIAMLQSSNLQLPGQKHPLGHFRLARMERRHVVN
jgi:hypothetical protein